MHRALSLALFLLVASASAQATPYVFVANHSQGTMRWNHLGFSHPSAQFSRIEGTLDWNVADPTKSTVKATIAMSALTTGVPDLDEHFASTDFFDTPNHPAITFVSTRVEKGAMAGQLKLAGDLQVHGVTRPVVLDVAINKVGTNPRNNLPTVGFEATATLKRSDFGLGRFVPQVSDEIGLALTIEAVDAAAKTKYEAEEAAKEAAEKAEAEKKAAERK